jgi:hypothetical protein
VLRKRRLRAALAQHEAAAAAAAGPACAAPGKAKGD